MSKYKHNRIPMGVHLSLTIVKRQSVKSVEERETKLMYLVPNILIIEFSNRK